MGVDDICGMRYDELKQTIVKQAKRIDELERISTELRANTWNIMVGIMCLSELKSLPLTLREEFNKLTATIAASNDITND